MPPFFEISINHQKQKTAIKIGIQKERIAQVLFHTFYI